MWRKWVTRTSGWEIKGTGSAVSSMEGPGGVLWVFMGVFGGEGQPVWDTQQSLYQTCFVDLKLADRTPEKEDQEKDVVVAEVGVVVVVKVEVEVRGKDDLVGFGSGVE